MSEQAALFEVETMGGLICPHCGATSSSDCAHAVGKVGLQVMPWPEHCLRRPDPATMPIPF